MSFEVKISLTFLIAGLIYWYSARLQKQKEDAADRQFELTIKALEAKAKKEIENGNWEYNW